MGNEGERKGKEKRGGGRKRENHVMVSILLQLTLIANLIIKILTKQLSTLSIENLRLYPLCIHTILHKSTLPRRKQTN